MPNFNNVVIAGNLTRDLELKYLKSGTAVGSTSMAINRRFPAKDGGEAKEEVTFIELKAWGKQAEVLSQYVKKGDPILVQGRLTQDRWEGEDGKGRSKLYVTIETFQFLGGKKNG
jgi:single-strand DNA-binding protein